MMRKSLHVLVLLLILSMHGHAQVKTWTFQECVDRAVEQNISIRQERLNNEIDGVNLKQSKYLRTPSLNFNANQGFNMGRSVDPFTNQYVNQNIRTNNFSLSGSVTLFNGFQNLNTIQQNKLYFEAGKLDIVLATNNVIINLASAYLAVLLSHERLEIAQNQVKVTEEQVSRTEQLLEAGKVPELDVFKISAQLESDKLAHINAENQVVLSKLALAQIMNLPASESFEIEKIVLEVTPLYADKTTEDLYILASTVNPAVKSAAVIKQSSLVGLKISRGALLPRLSLGGNIVTGYSSARTLSSSQLTYQTQPIGYLQSNPTEVVMGSIPTNSTTRADYPFDRQLNDNISRSVAFTLSVPIFNNRQFRSNIDRAKINIKSAELNEQNIHNMLRKDIEQSHADMKASYKKFQASERQVVALEKSYSGTELKYSLGMTSPTDLIIEKNNYVRGQSDLLQAKYEYLFNAKIIDLYVGKEVTF